MRNASLKIVGQRHTFFDDFEENHSAEGECCTIEPPASPPISKSRVKT